MTDLSDTILPKSEQLTADHLRTGSLTICIRDVKRGSDKKQPIAILWDDRELPYYPAKSMRIAIVEAWGPKSEAYIGRSLTLYRDPTVMYGGIEVGGIKISHMTDLPAAKLKDGVMPVAITIRKGLKGIHEVRPLRIQQPATKPPEEETRPRDTAPPETDRPAERTKKERYDAERELDRLKVQAIAATDSGTDAFRVFWTETLTKPQRASLAEFLTPWKTMSAASDRRLEAERNKVDGSPWGLDDPEDDGPPELDKDGELEDGSTGEVME